MKKFVCLAAFGLVAWFVTSPAPAAAQFYIGRPGALVLGWSRYGLYDWTWSPRYYRPAWRPVYYYPIARVSYSYPYTAYYPQEQAVDVNTVTIRLHVPSDARIWIEDAAMSQSGADRSFVSPPLTPGYDYTYHIRVRWDENGQAVERSREVKVHAGDRINLTIDK